VWVVKLGGSLDAAGRLRDWALALAESPAALIVVPGGGPFADAVRAAQDRWGLDDETAHRMAILAMEQNAHLLCGLSPRLVPVRHLLSQGPRPSYSNTRVWFPAADLLEDRSVAHSWDVTSDSLAAILAGRIGADALALVKAAPFAGLGGDLTALQRAGALDATFHTHARRCACPVWVLPASDSGSFPRLLGGEASGLEPGARALVLEQDAASD
jgi:aspartokinase-like uncharacterized kinase